MLSKLNFYTVLIIVDNDICFCLRSAMEDITHRCIFLKEVPTISSLVDVFLNSNYANSNLSEDFRETIYINRISISHASKLYIICSYFKSLKFFLEPLRSFCEVISRKLLIK